MHRACELLRSIHGRCMDCAFFSGVLKCRLRTSFRGVATKAQTPQPLQRTLSAADLRRMDGIPAHRVSTRATMRRSLVREKYPQPKKIPKRNCDEKSQKMASSSPTSPARRRKKQNKASTKSVETPSSYGDSTSHVVAPPRSRVAVASAFDA